MDESNPQGDPFPPGQHSRETRRKGTGGLRVSQNQSSFQEDLTEHQRQMQVDSRSFPKRKKVRRLSQATSFFLSAAGVSLES
jgi:ATP-dependent RNA helicase DDX49/DBP8